jgi:hypothetical protein
MTISKGANVGITSGTSDSISVAAFSSSLAGIAYLSGGAKGYLLNISGTVVTTLGGEATLDTAITGPLQRAQLVPVNANKLRLLTVDDSSPSGVVHLIPITKTATDLVAGSILTLTYPDDVSSSFVNAAYPWDDYTLVVVLRVDAPTAFYLSLADDTTQGNVVVFSPATAPLGAIPTFAAFGGGNGIMLYKQSTSNDFMGVELTRTGSTLTAGTPFTIDTSNVAASNTPFGAIKIDSSNCLIGYIDTGGDRRYKIIQSNLTEGSILEILGTDFISWCEKFHAGSAVIYSHLVSSGGPRWTEVTISGTTLTQTNEITSTGDENATTRGSMTRLDNSHILACWGNATVTVAVITTDVTPPGISSTDFTIGAIAAKPCDVDADGAYIYLGLIASDTTPILVKFATALNADGEIVFEPGAGTDIGVQCGRFDADVVWVAGDFDGTNAVEKSENAGTSFAVKDPGTFGAVSAFIVGPDSDERVLIFDSADGEISETIDDGVSWSQKKTGLGYDCHALDRLDINVEEVVFGNDSGATHVVDYSVNTGQNLADYTLTLPVTQDVTGVIVN